MMEETYKDWKIKLDEKADVFVATKDEHSLKSKSLKDLKNKIDKFKFERIPVYYKYGNRLESGEITSITEDKNRRTYSNYYIVIWVTYGKDKNRTKTHLDYLYKQSEKNKILFDEVKKLEKSKDEIEKQIDVLLEKFENPLTRQDVGLPLEAEKSLR